MFGKQQAVEIEGTQLRLCGFNHVRRQGRWFVGGVVFEERASVGDNEMVVGVNEFGHEAIDGLITFDVAEPIAFAEGFAALFDTPACEEDTAEVSVGISGAETAESSVVDDGIIVGDKFSGVFEVVEGFADFASRFTFEPVGESDLSGDEKLSGNGGGV